MIVMGVAYILNRIFLAAAAASVITGFFLALSFLGKDRDEAFSKEYLREKFLRPWCALVLLGFFALFFYN